jgi:hypothetical protein
MISNYYDPQELVKRTERPTLKREGTYTVSEARIITPADPEKLKALQTKRDTIDKRREAAGLSKERNGWVVS